MTACHGKELADGIFVNRVTVQIHFVSFHKCSRMFFEMVHSLQIVHAGYEVLHDTWVEAVELQLRSFSTLRFFIYFNWC